VLAAKYGGHIGIEYEGGRLGEAEGIRATKKLLETIRDELAAEKPADAQPAAAREARP
jgi:hypothetical protein